MSALLTCCVLVLTASATAAWSFYSTIEATTVFAPDSMCMGDCTGVWGEKKCVFAWNGSEAKCFSKGTTTLRYRTEDNVECISNCARFNAEDYEWCATSEKKWDKCSRRIALVAQRTWKSADNFATCKDECAKRESSYNWCNTVRGIWQHCKPKALTHTFNYPTVDGSTCAGLCAMYKGYPNCYTQKGTWSQCYLNPSYDSKLRVIDVNLHRECGFDTYETSGGHVQCAHRHRRPRKRAADDDITNELYFECNAAIDTVLTSHTRYNPTEVIRVADPDNMITTDTNPILSYTVLPTISYFSDNDASVELPLVVEALLTTHTLASSRERFTNDVDTNYNNMDRTFNHENYDERGHILANRLGGPMEIFNVFPQSWRMNRGRNSLWFGLEVDMDNFLRGHSDRYIRFTAILSYATDDDHVLIHRPHAIILRVRAYDDGQQVDLSNGNPIDASTNPSTTERMFFSNDPNISCEPLPAPANG